MGIHYNQDRTNALNGTFTSQNGFFQAGNCLERFHLLGITRKNKRIHAGHAGIIFHKASGIHRQANTLICCQARMVLTVRANQIGFLKLAFRCAVLAAWAFKHGFMFCRIIIEPLGNGLKQIF